jgi:hypothetical protein
MEAQFVAQLADLKEGLYVLVNEDFARKQFALQRRHPDIALVLMSPKECVGGRCLVAFCLDMHVRHPGLREARRMRSLAWRTTSGDGSDPVRKQ